MTMMRRFLLSIILFLMALVIAVQAFVTTNNNNNNNNNNNIKQLPLLSVRNDWGMRLLQQHCRGRVFRLDDKEQPSSRRCCGLLLLPLLQLSSKDDAEDGIGNDNKNNNDDDIEEGSFYDDFGGQMIGGGNGGGGGSSSNNNNNNNLWQQPTTSFPSSNTELQERIRVLQQDELVKDAQVKRNWKIGNWKVRGFALDPDDGDDYDNDNDVAPTVEEKASSLDDDDKNNNNNIPRNKQDRSSSSSSSIRRPKILVSRLYWDKSSLASSRPRILVGRTDGSVFVVQLGTEYLTKLSKTTTTTTTNNNSNNNDMSMNNAAETGFSFARLDKDESSSTTAEPYVVDDDDDDDFIYGKAANPPTPSVPFKICHHFQASQKNNNNKNNNKHNHHAICSILSLDDEPFIFTAVQGEGTITQWQLFDDDDNDNDDDDAQTGMRSQLYRTFQGIHGDGTTILYLDAISLSTRGNTKRVDVDDSPNVLISVSTDGIVALWDLNNGTNLLQLQAKLPDNDNEVTVTANDGAVTSATADVASGTIFVGMTSGHVLAYSAQDLLSKASSSSAGDGDGGTATGIALELSPNGRFLAHEKGPVTSMTCAGSGSLIRPRRRQRGQSASMVLLTGGSDGVVKQWEILPVKTGSSGETKLEQWPRLSNQRLSKRAHLFKGGHESSVRAIVSIDSTKFVSASDDGSIVAWSANGSKDRQQQQQQKQQQQQQQQQQQLFRMEGFSDKISSLLLLDHLLITDGMEDYVCVHDFEVDGSEVEEGYEFEW